MADPVILIADDNEVLLILIRATLKSPGIGFLEAHNGRQALELAQEHRPALLIMDWMMPELSGTQVAEALRAHEMLVPILMLTARNQDADRRRAEQLGICTYLTKPFSPLALIEAVEGILNIKIA